MICQNHIQSQDRHETRHCPGIAPRTCLLFSPSPFARALLVLRSLREKTQEDPTWRSTMPRDQTMEFNRLIVLMNACNIYLPLYITMVEQSTERLCTKLHWLMTMSELGSAVWHIASLVPPASASRARSWQRTRFRGWSCPGSARSMNLLARPG